MVYKRTKNYFVCTLLGEMLICTMPVLSKKIYLGLSNMRDRLMTTIITGKRSAETLLGFNDVTCDVTWSHLVLLGQTLVMHKDNKS